MSLSYDHFSNKKETVKLSSTLICGKWLTIVSASELLKKITVERFVIKSFGENSYERIHKESRM